MLKQGPQIPSSDLANSNKSLKFERISIFPSDTRGKRSTVNEKIMERIGSELLVKISRGIRQNGAQGDCEHQDP